jgi:hypothetical protein
VGCCGRKTILFGRELANSDAEELDGELATGAAVPEEDELVEGGSEGAAARSGGDCGWEYATAPSNHVRQRTVLPENIWTLRLRYYLAGEGSESRYVRNALSGRFVGCQRGCPLRAAAG